MARDAAKADAMAKVLAAPKVVVDGEPLERSCRVVCRRKLPLGCDPWPQTEPKMGLFANVSESMLLLSVTPVRCWVQIPWLVRT